MNEHLQIKFIEKTIQFYKLIGVMILTVHIVRKKF